MSDWTDDEALWRLCPVETCNDWFIVSRPESKQVCCSVACADEFMRGMPKPCDDLTDEECAALMAEISDYQRQRREAQL